MKFVHIADMHFDTSFTQINDSNLGSIRRLDQRKVFEKVIDYIEENNVDYLFIAGDLYEHKYIKESTIQFINNQFKKIPNTKIFISPGNHDPYMKNSFYNKFNWNNNVYIFKSNITKVQDDDVNIYGYGFDDFYYTNDEINNFELDEKHKINILVTHGTLNGTNNIEKQYNAISKAKLQSIGFDYVALGHIHKANYNEEKNIIYPGSTVSMGFDEQGKHGMVVGEISKQNLNINFVPLDECEFVTVDVDVTEFNSEEDLVQYVSCLNINENNYYEVYLVGERNFEIDMYKIKKMITSPRIIKIKNKTKMRIDIQELANENTLKGLFIKEVLDRMENEENKEVLEKALEIGLEILEK